MKVYKLEVMVIDHDELGPDKTVFVRDACGKLDKKIAGLKAPDWEGDRETARSLDLKIEAATEKLSEFMNRNYPDWRSPIAYWED